MGAIGRFEAEFLARRGPRPLHRSIEITKAGVVFGSGTILAPMRPDDAGRRELDLSGEDRILTLLAATFERPIDPAFLGKLQRASELWTRGERSLAHIHLTQLRLPKLESEEQAFRLFLADGLIAAGFSPRDLCKALGFDLPEGLKRYSPDQPRDSDGRWTDGSGAVDSNIILVSADNPEKEEDDPLYQERRALGEETPEEDERHGRPIDPMGQTPFPFPEQRPAIAPSSTPKPSDFVGQDFGKLGVGVGKPELDISRGTEHGDLRVGERGVSGSDMQETVNNPLLVLRQATGRRLFLSDKAVVVLSQEGYLITTYPASNFDERIKAILDHIHGN